MSVATSDVTAVPKKRILWKRLLIGALVIVVIGAAANLLGWDIGGWFSDVWDTMKEISIGYVIGAAAFETLQTTATAFAWYSILRFAYPERTRWLQVLASYAASVALNGILPANLGTFALLFMFTTLLGTTFAGILGAYAVEKIFFMVIGVFVWLYLFFSVSGSFDIKFEWIREHPWATAILVVGCCVLLFLLGRRYWPRVVRWWDSAREGGAILAHPGAYFGRVFLPSFVAWCAGLGVMAVFLAAYGIPVTFDTLMRIWGGNSIANVTSVTPGGAGVNQAFNVASLNGVASTTDATAYSVAQQLLTTTWDILFAIVLLAVAFGWSSGRELVQQSLADAKAKAAEEQTARRARKAAKQEAAGAAEQ